MYNNNKLFIEHLSYIHVAQSALKKKIEIQYNKTKAITQNKK